MAEFRLQCNVRYTFTYVGTGGPNQLDTLTLGIPPAFSAAPSDTGFSISGEFDPAAVYVSSRVLVDDSWALESLPEIWFEPEAGTVALGRSVSVFYRAIVPAISHCAYRLQVLLATPTDAEGSVLSMPKVPAEGRIIVFEAPGFQGAYRVIDRSEADLSASHGGFVNSRSSGNPGGNVISRPTGFLNDQVSSFIVASGRWMLFRHRAFQHFYRNSKEPHGNGTFGPGLYGHLASFSVENDQISSLLCVES